MLRSAILATLGFFAAELAAGWYAQSLALISDAWHNLAAALALLVTWSAYYVQGKAPSRSKTYGYHRAGVLGAFVAALALMLVAGGLFYSGFRRSLAPPEPETTVMLLTGAAGAALNLALSAALRGASWVGARPRTVMFHLAGDALASMAIVVAAVLVRFTGLRVIDPVLGILIAGLVIWTAWDIVAESLNILLEGLPRGISLEQVVETIRGVPGVEDIHDLHIWSLGARTQALSCHVRIADIPLPDGEAILSEVNAVLERRFRIGHTTIQLEHVACDAEHGCLIPSSVVHPHSQ